MLTCLNGPVRQGPGRLGGGYAVVVQVILPPNLSIAKRAGDNLFDGGTTGRTFEGCESQWGLLPHANGKQDYSACHTPEKNPINPRNPYFPGYFGFFSGLLKYQTGSKWEQYRSSGWGGNLQPTEIPTKNTKVAAGDGR